ncbi:phage minor capsid protein [Prescottella equi]|uniref:phage minor capsid protein n=1 Tax=Rhodococcus hoagii TaxID=43767 RepID=UPI001EEB370C|nr:phage minor capsid protein [Prescottella equi]
MPLTPSFGDKLAARVTNLYAAAEEGLIRYVAGKAAGDLNHPQSRLARLALRIGPVRVAVGRILDKLRADSRVRVSEAMREAMENGRQAAIDDLTPTVRVPVYPVDGASAQRAEALNQKLERPLERAKLVTENAYQRIILEVTAGHEAKSDAARKRLVQRALDKFAAEGITGFVDKRGRSYDLVSYAEMAVRTAITEAEVSAYLAQARHAGHDLVIISDVPQSCVLCAPFEGRVLSITGATRGAITTNPATGRSERIQVYASIEEAKARGLWHPGCRHTVKIWTPSDPMTPRDTPPDPEGQKAREKLRRLERRVRRWKRVLEVAQSPQAEASAKRHIRAAQADIRRHVAATKIARDRDREQLHRGYQPANMAAGSEGRAGGSGGGTGGPPKPPDPWGSGANPPYEPDRHRVVLAWANQDPQHAAAHRQLNKLLMDRWNKDVVPLEEIDAALAALESARDRLGIAGLIDETSKPFDADETHIAVILAREGNNVTSILESRVFKEKSADAAVGAVRTEFKALTSKDRRKAVQRMSDAAQKSDEMVLWFKNPELNQAIANGAAKTTLLNWPNVRYIRLIGDDYDDHIRG